MKPIRSLRILLAILAWLIPALALAHPIAQGALDLDLSPGRLHARARVPVEEVLVANAFAAGGAASLAEAYAAHGQYFLRHLQISADGQPLPGTLARWSEDGAEHLLYEIDYPLPSAPRQLELRQNLLNEFLYAPGNPWEASFAVRLSEAGQPKQEGLLLTSRQPLAVANLSLGADRPRMLGEYFQHGVWHILEGYDHLLFIAALVLATATLWDLIKVVTAFTLAHTLTLALSVLDVVRLPSSVVEPMIAASIVCVALANVVRPRPGARGGLLLASAFFFGLFHGLGFAGGLLDAMAGMPGIAVGVAILGFSLGVEAGHQAVVLPVFAGLKLLRSLRMEGASRERLVLGVVRLGSLLISVAGTVYLIAALH
jgi:hydrogenase/urease accessory protein HupE